MIKIELEFEPKNNIDLFHLGKHITNNMPEIFGEYSKNIESVTCMIYSDEEVTKCSNCTCDNDCQDEEEVVEEEVVEEELDSDVEYIDFSEIDTDTLLEEIRNRINE